MVQGVETTHKKRKIPKYLSTKNMMKNAMEKNAMAMYAMAVNAMDNKSWKNYLYEIENQQIFALGKHIEKHYLEENTGESSSKSLVKESSSKSLGKDSSYDYGNRGHFRRKSVFVYRKLFKIIDLTQRSPGFSYDLKQNMDVLSYIPISRYSSGIKDDILPYCSKLRLSRNIDFLYRNFEDLFPELTSKKVNDISQSIIDGTYTLSPLRLNVFSKSQIGELKRPKYHYIMHVKDEPNLCYCVNPTQEDRLVLLGLGLMLNQKIILDNLLMENSVGLRIQQRDYLYLVCMRENVTRLYKFDLTNSMKTINRDNLLSKLSHIVMDGEILSLVGQFLYLPITDESGIEYNTGVNILPSGHLTDVLLNFALIEFDKGFQRLFPKFYFTRFLNEVLVYFSTSESKLVESFSIFEKQVVILFDQLNLSGKIISIGPGDAPVPCLGGLVSVSQDGQIQVEMKEQ